MTERRSKTAVAITSVNVHRF